MGGGGPWHRWSAPVTVLAQAVGLSQGGNVQDTGPWGGAHSSDGLAVVGAMEGVAKVFALPLTGMVRDAGGTVSGEEEELALACRHSLVPFGPSLQSASRALSFVPGSWQVTMAWERAGQ